MPAARPAAGRGGKTKRQHPHARTSLHASAREAGLAGEPAPGWIDDADLLDSYDTGLAEYEASFDAPTPEPATESGPEGTGGDNGGKAPSAAAEGFTPAAAPTTPETMPQFDSGSRGSRNVGPFAPKGTAGDAAGAFLGILAAAFLQNVLAGRWTDWLRAKFLNEVSTTGILPGGGGRTATTKPDGTITLPPTTTGPGTSQSIPGLGT